ncbi:MAG TPA: DUF779 domain-containing protein [Solirubrobacteraceae bacterium]|nr:DUF779 domain-containing protein [Solirubrobacteraceae bacterium]
MAVDIVLTDAARSLLGRGAVQRQGALSLVIGNGCCDSTAPFLFEAYMAGPGEAQVAEVEGVPVLLDAALLELFEGREVVVDAAPADAMGEDSLSCEAALGMRFSLARMPGGVAAT